MKKISIRPQRITDAKRFFDILNNDNFQYFEARPKTVKEEIDYLKKNSNKRKKHFEYNFTILYGKEIVGGCGIRIDQHRTHNAEIGYFVDEKYWGKGIATTVVKLIEKKAFNELKLIRIETYIHPKNIGSIKVALKNKFKKEGILKKRLFLRGKYCDAVLLAKVK